MPPPPKSTRPRPSGRPAAAPEPEEDASATLSEGDEAPADPNATMLMDSAPAPAPVKKAGGSPKFSVTRGPKAGAEFNIGPGETSVGRQGDNTIVIPDISVSRKHIVIVREGAKCVLVDQGSGNGTMLNGARVEAETELQDGDIIVMGDTELTFLAPRAAPRTATGAKPAAGKPSTGRRPATAKGPISKRPQPVALGDDEAGGTGQMQLPEVGASKKASRKRMLIIGGVAIVFFVLLGAVKVRQDKIAREHARVQAEREFQQAASELDKIIEAGKKATASGDFKRAAETFQKALEYAKEFQTPDPTWNSRVSDSQRRYDASKKEFANQEILEAAKELCEKGDLAAAVEKLKTIPEDSLTADRIPKALEACKAKIEDRINAGKDALKKANEEKKPSETKTRNLEAARQAVTDVLAVDPTNTDAQALSEAVQKAGAPAPKVSGPVKAKESSDDPTAKIAEVFNSGKLDEAIGMAAACEDARCAQLKDKMTTFKDLYGNVEGEGNVTKAVAILKSIPGGSGSAYMAKIGAVGSGTFIKEGLKAMTAENYPKAYTAFKQVIAVNPGDEVAKRNLGIINQKAKELSEQAYIDMQQDPDKARRELELILQMTDPGSELNTKAKNRIKKLGGGE
ncbi:MAG: FHA domain-containing protein [Myxococcales bacterium]